VHDGQPLPVPGPGTLLHTPDGEVVLYVGDAFEATALEVGALAARLRDARRIVVVGDMWQAAKPWKNAIHNAWTAANKAARDAAKPPRPAPVVKAPGPRCGRPGKTGAPCGMYAGWGSDTPGAGPCFYHGGSTEKQDAALRRLGEQARLIARLTRRAATRELTAAERLEGAVALREIAAARESRRRRRRT
jgi:hypothetical protein